MKKRIHTLLLTILLFCFSFSAYSQYGLTVAKTHPRQDFGKVFKSSTAFEFNYFFNEIDDKLRLSVSVGFMRLNTVQDTFKVFAYRSGGDGLLLDSGYELYENYYSIPIAFKNSYRFLDSDLSPTASVDIYVFFNDYYYEYNVPSLAAETEQGGSMFLGYQGRIGLSYLITDELDINLDFGRTATWEQGDGKFTFWRTAFSITYYAF